MKTHLNALTALMLFSGAAIAGEYSEGSNSDYMHGSNPDSSASYGYVGKQTKRYRVETNALAVEDVGAPTRAERELRRLEEKNEGSIN